MNTSSASFAETHLVSENANKMIKYIVLAVLGSLVLTLAAKTQVMQLPVPITLQTLAIFAISAAFGRKLAVATLLLYLGQGLVGLPVFAGPVAGPAYMAGGTAGYLVGFVIAAFIVGWAADKGWSKNPLKMAGAMLVADVVIFALGFAWLATIIGPEKAFLGGVAPFIVADLIKIALASSLVAALWQFFRKA
jgi:biotin transport system substrate-specific component